MVWYILTVIKTILKKIHYKFWVHLIYYLQVTPVKKIPETAGELVEFLNKQCSHMTR